MAGRRSTFGLDLDNDLNRNRMSFGPVRLHALTKGAGTNSSSNSGGGSNNSSSSNNNGGNGAGAAGRPSLAPNALPRPSMGRPSLAPGNNSSGGTTFAPRASDFAMSMGGSVYDRRGSIYRSLATADGPRKDPRNIRDRDYQHRCIRTLIRFLADAGYDRPVSPKILNAPSVKDFQNIFTFLYHQLDPAYVFGTKFEEEIPNLIRNIGYPFYNDISKSHLQAVGSIHAWPVLLAMLTWLVELIVACGLNLQGQQAPARERLFFNYLSKAYQMWMAGHDTFDSLLADLGQGFDKKNQVLEADAAVIVEQQRRIRQQIEQLDRDQPSLSILQQRKAELESDLSKYHKVIELLRSKNAKLSATQSQQTAELEHATKEVNSLRAKKAQLQTAVANQELSASDVEAMKMSLSKLEESVANAVKVREQAAAQVWDREMLLAKKQTQVETAANAYHAMAARMHILPGDGAHTRDVDYMLALNLQAPQTVLATLKNTIRPGLTKLRQGFADQAHEARAQQMVLQDRIDMLNEQLVAANDAIKLLEAQLARTEASFNADKERMAKEAAAETAEVDALEAQLAELRQDAGPMIVQRQGRLQKLRLEYAAAAVASPELSRGARTDRGRDARMWLRSGENPSRYEALAQTLDADKERCNREILAMLDTLVEHKNYIETTLADLLASVASA